MDDYSRKRDKCSKTQQLFEQKLLCGVMEQNRNSQSEQQAKPEMKKNPQKSIYLHSWWNPKQYNLPVGYKNFREVLIYSGCYFFNALSIECPHGTQKND